MTRAALWILLLPILPLPTLAADELRVNQLEREVRDLQRQVLSLSRQIAELERVRPERPAERGVAPAARPGDSTAWVDAGKWRRIRIGMGELEVIETLGPPTTMREEKGARVLLYAMEVGSSGFLSGSVTLRERVVSGLQQPALR